MGPGCTPRSPRCHGEGTGQCRPCDPPGRAGFQCFPGHCRFGLDSISGAAAVRPAARTRGAAGAGYACAYINAVAYSSGCFGFVRVFLAGPVGCVGKGKTRGRFSFRTPACCRKAPADQGGSRCRQGLPATVPRRHRRESLGFAMRGHFSLGVWMWVSLNPRRSRDCPFRNSVLVYY